MLYVENMLKKFPCEICCFQRCFSENVDFTEVEENKGKIDEERKGDNAVDREKWRGSAEEELQGRRANKWRG